LWLHSLKVAQLLRSAASLHTSQSRSYLNHLVDLVIWIPQVLNNAHSCGQHSQSEVGRARKHYIFAKNINMMRVLVCLLLSITNKMQRYTLFCIIVNAVHVSGGFSAHHQELKNCTHNIGYMSSLLACCYHKR